MKKSDLKKYAKTIVKMGANIKPGQDAIIVSSVNNVELVRLIVEEAYKAKARKVIVEWNDDAITKMNYTYQSLETLSEYPKYAEEKLKYRKKAMTDIK